MIYIPSSSTSAAYNLAVEEFLLTRVTSGELLMLWKSAPTVVIGKFQNAFGEVSVGEIERRNIVLVRRNSGGGTVYHDEGNLNFTIIADRGENSPDYERFLLPVVDALQSLGITAAIGDAFDITVDGKKVSGNAQSVVKNRVMHHGTLLFDADLSVLSDVTGHARADVRSKAIPSHPSPVGNLRPYLKNDMDIDTFANLLKIALCGKNAEVRSFTEEELREIERLRDEKYGTWDWNYGKSPAFTKDCGTFSVDVKSGIVTAVHGNDGLAKILVGCRMNPTEIREVAGDDVVRALFR